MTTGKSSDKEGKRSRLGNRVQRGVYCHAHGWKHPWWGALSLKALQLNKMTSTPQKIEAHLDAKEQARIVERTKAEDAAARFRLSPEGDSRE